MQKLISIEREGHGACGVGAFHSTTVSVLGKPILTYSRGPEDMDLELSVGLARLNFFAQRPVGNIVAMVNMSGGLILRGPAEYKCVPVPFITATVDSFFGSMTVEVL